MAGVGVVVATAVAAGACSDFLKVTNPGAVSVDRLADSVNANLAVNGVIGQFQTAVGRAALWGGVLGDEIRSAHVNISYGPIDRRDFNELNDLLNQVYPNIQRLRYAGDTIADRLKGFGGAAAARDLRVARVLAMAGYGYVLLGEQFCRAPINGGASQTPQQLFQAALPRFQEAITVATAGRTVATLRRDSLAADSILTLATVGAARAALNLDDKARAIQFAQQTPASGEYRAYYVEGIPPQPGLEQNPFWNGTGSPELARTGFNTNQSGGINYAQPALWTVVDTAFIGINDPRVPMSPARVRAMDASQQFVPNKPASFSGWTPPSAGAPGGAPVTPGSAIRVASALEARYVIAEASGGTAGTLAFVNAQRAANGQPALDTSEPGAVLAALREQRAREFYLDGRRLGDLRRYKARYGVDLFPSGPYRGSSTDRYGTVECFPVPISELNANPNAGG